MSKEELSLHFANFTSDFSTLLKALAPATRDEKLVEQSLQQLELSQKHLLKVARQIDAKQSLKQKAMAVQEQMREQEKQYQQLLSTLKSAETILERVVYAGDQKLEKLRSGNTNKISVDEVVRYAKWISDSHGTAAPLGWTPEDRRRPYPSDAEMKGGLLASLQDDAQESGTS